MKGLRALLSIGLVLAGLASTGCATRYAVTEEEVQREIDRKLPVSVEQKFNGALVTALVSIDKLALRLPEQPGERLRLVGDGTLETRYGGFALAQPVSAELTGHLRYDPDAKQIRLIDAQVASLEAPVLAQLLPAELYRSLVTNAGQALVAALSERPLYTVGGRNRAESTFRDRGTSIETRDRQIIFNLK